MKKILTTILAVLYICTSTGATIHLHYCMGELAGWGFGDNTSKTCSNCGMKKVEGKDNGCCKDEHKFIKNVQDQKTAEAGLQITAFEVVTLPVSFFVISSPDFSSVKEESPFGHAPPRSCGVAVYIRNGVFLI
jgi:hypothetical protein